MPQYLLSVHGNEESINSMSPEDTQKMFAQVGAFNAELSRSGSFVFADGLELADMATVVKNENGKTITTDGPYLETKEHIAGFWIIKAEDLDAALALAAKATTACMVPVEVRPFRQGSSEN